MSQSSAEGAREICNRANTHFDDGRIADGVAVLFDELTHLRRDLDDDEWRVAREAAVACEAVRRVVHQDPITRHSFDKPRGYAGDAELLDRIYDDAAPGESSDVGRQVWSHTSRVAEAEAVRERRTMLAGLIRSTLDEAPNGSVLSIACGHLREILDIGDLPPSASVVGLDQDVASLAEVRRSLPSPQVLTVRGSVKTVLNGQVDGEGYDFVYAAGLYDYLSTPLARRLTQKMFELLRPGGLLLVANFAKGTSGVGYMESFMDWHLRYRDAAEVADFATLVPAAKRKDFRVFSGENRHVHYLTCRRL